MPQSWCLDVSNCCHRSVLEEAGQREARLRKTTEEARRGREEDDLLQGRHGELGEETEDDRGRGRKGRGGGREEETISSSKQHLLLQLMAINK